ncbi:glycoside hydrolase family 19 protein [Sphingobacterium sp. Lzh-3]|uniref:glycoside hydrolase family 19 protein n=1 Tax=Sphingobacterium sp. Lzh-3 TaxID=3382150 RepID=UPI00398CDC0A
MTAKERIKELQKSVGASADGIIGRETLTKFAATFGRTRVQTIHFFANIHHESGGFTIVRENMNYTAPRIMEIFGIGRHSAKVTVAEAGRLAGNPWDLAERIYGFGNPKKAKELGNTRPGDGWKYRGGGALQCTGGFDYKRYGGQELYDNPDLIGESAYYFTTALKEFDAKNIWAKAKDLSQASIRAVCLAVNGGYNGLDDRRAKINYYASLWK